MFDMTNKIIIRSQSKDESTIREIYYSLPEMEKKIVFSDIFIENADEINVHHLLLDVSEYGSIVINKVKNGLIIIID